MNDTEKMHDGLCEHEGCRETGLVFLNGQRLLCWDHYVEVCDAARDRQYAEDLLANAEKLMRKYGDAVSIVAAKARLKHKGLEDDPQPSRLRRPAADRNRSRIGAVPAAVKKETP